MESRYEVAWENMNMPNIHVESSLLQVPYVPVELRTPLQQQITYRNLVTGGILVAAVLFWTCASLVLQAWSNPLLDTPTVAEDWSRRAGYTLVVFLVLLMIAGARIWPETTGQISRLHSRFLIGGCWFLLVWCGLESGIQFSSRPFAMPLLYVGTVVALMIRLPARTTFMCLVTGMVAFVLMALAWGHPVAVVFSHNWGVLFLLLLSVLFASISYTSWIRAWLQGRYSDDEYRKIPITPGSSALQLHAESLAGEFASYQQHLLDILRCSPDICVTVSREGRLTFLSRPFPPMTIGCMARERAAELFGRRVGESLARAVEQVFDGSAPLALESRTVDGSYLQIRITPLSHVDGSVEEVMIIATDVTEKHETERHDKAVAEKLEQAERLESLVSLAGGMAHELNNVLGPVAAMPSLIMMDLASLREAYPELIGDLEEDLKRLRDAAKKAGEIIHDLLTLGRQGHSLFQPLNLNGLVEDCLNSAEIQAIRKEAPRVALNYSCTDEKMAVNGSHNHLVRAFTQVLHNAFDAVPEEGTVNISVSRVATVEARVLHHGFLPPGNYVLVEISDNGMGIDADLLPRVFEPFAASKSMLERRANGLGLAIVHSVIKDHNGHMDIVSGENKGTVVHIYLPALQELVAVPPRQHELVRGWNERILIAEDDSSQRAVMDRALRALGYDITLASEGMEALRIFREELSEGRAFDLVLLDLVMEPDMDGLDALRQIREIQPKQKAVIVSGFLDAERMEEAHRLGAGWLAKPYILEELANEVNRTLHNI